MNMDILDRASGCCRDLGGASIAIAIASYPVLPDPVQIDEGVVGYVRI